MENGEKGDGARSYWEGERVRLRAMEPGDWEAYHAWNQDDEQARQLYFVPFPQSQEATRRFAERTATERPAGDNFRFVITNLAGEVVGDLTTHGCDPRHGTFGYGISIAAAHRRTGYAAEAITLVLRYYFEELRYQKVSVQIYSFNEPSLRLHERLGFQPEGRQRRMLYTRGQYFDVLLFGLTSDEFAARVNTSNQTRDS
jgi:RimJ/RimL family protein N-acetyltransferase